MKKYTTEELKARFSQLGYSWFNYHFIGIRSNANLPNQFDDLFCIVNGEQLTWSTCTTNPGTHWLKNLLNPKGTALLKPNQYIQTWQIGLHQNKYEAFTQAKPVEVYRDNNKNDLAEESNVIEKGFFGINIHRANDKMVSKFIDKWSAGCQVLNNPADFNNLLLSAKNSNNKLFTYTLLKEF